MLVHEKKAASKGEGVSLVGSPEKLIHLLIKNAIDQKSVLTELTNEGPKHKQVLTALLLSEIYKLLQTVEKSSGHPFSLQEGFEMVKDKEGIKKTMPVLLPINIEAKQNQDKIAEAVSPAPEHEALAYAMAIQVIDWAIKTIPKTTAERIR